MILPLTLSLLLSQGPANAPQPTATAQEASADTVEVVARARDLTLTAAELEPVLVDRYALGDEEFSRWHGLIRDYLEWRGMHAAN